MSKPTRIVYEIKGEEMFAKLPYGEIHIELEDTLADCMISFNDGDVVHIVVAKKYDNALPVQHEAGSVCAAIYWSRQRVLDGQPSGTIEYIEHREYLLG